MNREEERETVIARLIVNTRRKKRPNSLIEIANDIVWLQEELGSLEVVSEIIGISSEMLSKFLSVKRLSPAIRKLVEERKFDSVTIVHLMKDFDIHAQRLIADEVIAGRLSADDMKVLVPLSKRLPELDINQLISRTQRSKNVKVYILYFRTPPEVQDTQVLERRFEKVVGKNEIVSFTVKDTVGTLELNSTGLRKFRQAAKEDNLTLRKFVDMIVQEETVGRNAI
ncbi:MAG: hypothetical protein DDT30_01193 [Dehalococcoidia bacterium]|nr:hypothetical protein [Bacillota bacterium]MBT9140615.1 hypothetical protein [Bacillota bacterium]